MISRGAQLHFFCAFRMESVDGGKVDDVVETIRLWAESRLRGVSVPSAAFRAGGEWRAKDDPHSVIRSRSAGGAEGGMSKAWAMRLEHPDAEIKAREWRVDIGARSAKAGSCQLAVSVEHSARPGFSIDLPPPQPSAPDVVRRLLELPEFSAYAGTQHLSVRAVAVNVGDGVFFREALEDPDRRCPILYISRTQDGMKTLVQPDSLARPMAGAAVVYYQAERGVDEELKYVINRPYRCFDGAVRLYQPLLRLESQSDQIRHRYLRREEILDRGAEKALEAIVHAICRRPDPRYPPLVASIDDVDALSREARIEELRTTANDGQELAALYVQDLTRAKEEKESLAERLAIAERQLEGEQEQHEETRRELRRVEMELDVTRQQTTAEQTRFAEEFVRGLEIPTSLSEVLELAERMFPTRLLVTDRARESARKTSLRPTGVEKAWECLKAMSLVLHDLHLVEGLPLREIIDRFKNETGFDLSAGESEGTMADRKLAAKRRLDVAGRTFDISSHVKWGRKAPDCLRVHYAVDDTRKVLIIGHCGGHLDTVKTN